MTKKELAAMYHSRGCNCCQSVVLAFADDLGLDKEMVQKTDKSRASYYNYYTSKKWGDVSSYDLCINSAKIGVEHAGAPGTTAALALLNDQVKKGGIMASSYVGGLSGAFIPVSEDQGMIDAVNDGALTLEKLEAMTCVCSVGLDMIAIPGRTKAETISGIIADEMAIGMINQKTTAVRIMPVVCTN